MKKAWPSRAIPVVSSSFANRGRACCAASGAIRSVTKKFIGARSKEVISPAMVAGGRFEKLGGGDGYIWGSGAGYFEFLVPARNDHRRVGEIVVRAHIQPVLPVDARPDWIRTRVTLFVNGRDFGSRLIAVEDPKAPLIQEWRIDSWSLRLRAARGFPFTIRLAVMPESDWLYGINISNWPLGYESHDATPVEVEIR